MKDEHDSFTAEIIHIGSAAASKEKAAATRQKTREKREAYRAESAALTAQAQREAQQREEAVYQMAEAAKKAKPDPLAKAANAVNIAIQRDSQKLETWLPVSAVAVHFQVTPRRIRALLSDGRLSGRVQENGYWEVQFPYAFKFGTRGPQLRKIRPAKPELRTA